MATDRAAVEDPSFAGRSSNRRATQILISDRSQATAPSSFTQRLWENLCGPKWASYKSRMQATPWIIYKDADTEREFTDYTTASYTFRNPVCAFILIVIIAIFWSLLSSLMRDCPGLACTLVVTDFKFKNGFDINEALSISFAILLFFGNVLPVLKRSPEFSFYVLSVPHYVGYVGWICAVLIDGSVRRTELVGKVISVESAIQFKFWTDTTLLLNLMILVVFYDQVMNTRTIYVFFAHLVEILLYSASRVLLLYLYVDLITGEVIPAIILVSIFQIGFTAGLLGLAYIGRMSKELVERAAFLDIKDNQTRLKELRTAQKKKKQGKAQTLAESLAENLRKAQVSVQVAAFEKTSQGDSQLLEMDEVLNEVMNLLMETDDLFAVEGVDEDDVEGTNFITMFQLAKKQRRISQGTTDTETGIDMTQVQVDQQEFFSPDILPVFSPSRVIREGAGRSCSLRMLELHDAEPNLLVNVGLVLLEDHIPMLGVDRRVVAKYLYQVQRRYFPNPYHNACHGATVAHMATYASSVLEIDQCLRPVDRVALVVSALAHDMGHPGRNNNYFINSLSVLARVYNDLAVLENYHCFLAFKYAQISAEVNIFQSLSEEEYRSARALIIEFILVTDMSQHFASISKFRLKRSSDKFNVLENLEDAQLVAKLCVKIGDLSHGLVDWPQHLDWSLRVTQEFYLQGAEELELHLPLSPLCDPAAHSDFAKSQAGFLQFVVTPLATELSEIDPTGVFSGELLAKLLFNKHKWEMLKEKGDLIPISDYIAKMKVAPQYWADAMLLQAMRAKTVDDLNADALSIADFKSILVPPNVVQNVQEDEDEDEDEDEEIDEEEEEEIDEGLESIEEEESEEVEFDEVDDDAEEISEDEEEVSEEDDDEDG